VPREVLQDSEVLAGFVNKNGLLAIRVTKEFGQSTVARILDMMENASAKKAATENFITTFARYYTPVVTSAALLIAIVPPLIFNQPFSEWIYRALVFLVISCPCALVLSIPLGFFAGIGAASRMGILIKGGNYLEAMRDIDTMVFDKTGTLTEGVFEVAQIQPYGGFGIDELLRLAAAAGAHSTHPVAVSIRKAYGQEMNAVAVDSFEEIAGHGTKAVVGGKMVLVGNAKLMNREGIDFQVPEAIGTAAYIAIDGQFAGVIIISDKIKPDCADAMRMLKNSGVKKLVMLTGDSVAVAEATAMELGFDAAYAELLPDQKVSIVEDLLKGKPGKSKLVFVGDGINDAPVLARADVGVAMGGLGSDAAIEAADIVLMTDEPGKLLGAIAISRKTMRIVWQNIVFSLAVKVIVLMLGAIGAASMWAAVFADVGVSLLAVLNALRIMRVKQGVVTSNE
jgi:Cd2+/Zn2+-exporting ATPase